LAKCLAKSSIYQTRKLRPGPLQKSGCTTTRALRIFGDRYQAHKRQKHRAAPARSNPNGQQSPLRQIARSTFSRLHRCSLAEHPQNEPRPPGHLRIGGRRVTGCLRYSLCLLALPVRLDASLCSRTRPVWNTFRLIGPRTPRPRRSANARLSKGARRMSPDRRVSPHQIRYGGELETQAPPWDAGARFSVAAMRRSFSSKIVQCLTNCRPSLKCRQLFAHCQEQNRHSGGNFGISKHRTAR
jgi:hypothetical protein